MDNKEVSPDKEEKSILTIIQQIKEGSLNPQLLDKDTRRSCVDALKGESWTELNIAEFLRVSEKTVYRDLKIIRDKNSLTPNIAFVMEQVGDLVKKASALYDSLVRLSRGKEVSDDNKIGAVNSAWRILNEMTARLQTLGYMPLKTQVSDIYHHTEGGEVKTYTQLKEELQEIERIGKETGALDPKTEEGIKLLGQRIEKAEIAEKVVDIKKETDNKNKEEEKSHGEQ
jgi:hypothetical protein